ncbi:EAL domain-containing protein [Pelomonas sp. SE-A7]|uniref:putative bifunctional diguanylate cyclase/phosphodiesterase n=1 Tax=Pelomonas sp. SE-A7 TaxID=3054953 RepID=UPI00259CA415|nr:EAL domain-containing protein [Pelomonas sp. SE-A7]MDM4766169.1 EAL domain-containing protein [Pelomonas sp. SE-A7]
MLVQAKPWRARRGSSDHWLQGLHRFDAARGANSASFERRRFRMLCIASGLIMLIFTPWAISDILLGRVALFLSDLYFLVMAGLVVLLARQSLLRVASLLFTIAAFVGVVGLSVVVDVPSATLPRATQIYLIPLTVVAYFLLQYEVRNLRTAVPVLNLVAFVVLATTSSSFGFSPMVSEAERGLANNFASLLAAIALYAALTVMHREARESTALERAFGVAIMNGEIEAYLQPQCTAEGALIGAEALMRWRHPTRGYISPAEFIPMAEHSGLIVPAGEQLLGKVCELLNRWEGDAALSHVRVSVNVSPMQLLAAESAERLLSRVSSNLAARKVLKFELTESMFVEDFEMVHGRMMQIRASGIAIALDDFGTGFSSLNYLRRLPLDQLKVDQAFVKDLPAAPDASKIARTIVQLGKDLGLEVVAEGTETAEQVRALQEMGCEIFQGFFFSRPIPAEAFEALAQELHDGTRSLRPAAVPSC